MPSALDELAPLAAAGGSPLAMSALPPGWRKDDELRFKTWYAKARKAAKDAAGIDLDPNPDSPDHHYNYRFAFKAGAWPNQEGHWPSEFKAADHPNRFVDGVDTVTGEPAALGSALDAVAPRSALDELAPATSATSPAAAPERKRSLGFMTFPEEETGAFAPGPREFVSRMIRQVFSPIDPLRRGARAVAGAIDPTPQPAAEESRFETPTDLLGALKAAGLLAASPLLSIAGAARAVPGAASALAHEPLAAARGGLAGIVEGAGSLSPLDLLMLASGRKVGGEGSGGPRYPSGKPIEAPIPDISTMAPDALAELASRVGKISEETTGTSARPSPQHLVPRLVPGEVSPTGAGAGVTAKQGALEAAIRRAIEEPMDLRGAARRRQLGGGKLSSKAPTVEEALRAALQEAGMAEKPGQVSLPPSELPPRPGTGGRAGPGGTGIAEPGGMVGFAEESGQAAVRAGAAATQARAAEAAARDKAIDKAAMEQVKAAEKRARERAKETANEPAVPGTTRAKAYKKGATPAEAGAEAAKARAAESVTARSAEIAKEIAPPKAPPAPIPAEIGQRAQAEILTQFGRKASRQSEKLVKAGEEAGIGAPPPGIEPDHWARINAVEMEARDLYTKGIRDPRLIGEMRDFWGAKEAANRLGFKGEGGAELVHQIVGGPKRQPLVKIARETEARFRHLIEDPRGFMRTEALLAAGGAAAGGLVGAQIEGQDALDRLAYGLSGAIIGGAAGWAGGRGVEAAIRAARDPMLRRNVTHTVETIDSANLLAGPAAIKASLGSLGGIAAGLWERLREGRPVRDAMKFMISPGGMAKTYWDVLTGPTVNMRPIGAYTNNVAGRMGFFAQSTNKLTTLARQVLRPFIAADAAGSEAMRLMGFSKEEAGRMMLAGEPTSWQGQSVLRVINSSFALRMLVKFPRVRITGLERGFEYLPGTEKLKWMRNAPRAEQLSRMGRKGRREFGGAALVAGTAYGYFADPNFQEAGIASAAAGPAYLPAAMGIAAGTGLRHGQEPLTEALKSIASSIPQIGEADLRPGNLIRRVTPLGPLRRALERMMEEK